MLRATRPRLVFAVTTLVAVTAAALGVVASRSRAASTPFAKPPARSVAALPGGWSRVLPDWPRGLAADDRGAVVLMNTRVEEHELEGGGARWHAELPEAPWLDAPALDEHTVLVSTARELLAFDRVDGALRWRVASGGESAVTGFALTADGARVALVGIRAGKLRALDVATGASRWQLVRPGHPGGAIATADGLVAVTWETRDADALLVVDAATGAIRWERPLMVASSAPAIAGDLVVVGEGDDDYHAQAHAFALTDGHERWRTSLPGSFEDFSVPAASPPTGSPDPAGAVALMDHFGTVTLLGTADGALRWQVDLAEPVESVRPVVTQGAVAVRTERGSVVVLDRATGRVRTRRGDGASLPVDLGAGAGLLVTAWRLTEPGHLDATPLG